MTLAGSAIKIYKNPQANNNQYVLKTMEAVVDTATYNGIPSYPSDKICNYNPLKDPVYLDYFSTSAKGCEKLTKIAETTKEQVEQEMNYVNQEICTKFVSGFYIPASNQSQKLTNSVLLSKRKSSTNWRNEIQPKIQKPLMNGKKRKRLDKKEPQEYKPTKRKYFEDLKNQTSLQNCLKSTSFEAKHLKPENMLVSIRSNEIHYKVKDFDKSK